MKVKELIKELLGHNQEATILFSSDEELNCLHKQGQTATLSDRENCVVIYPLSGSETDD